MQSGCLVQVRMMGWVPEANHAMPSTSSWPIPVMRSQERGGLAHDPFQVLFGH